MEPVAIALIAIAGTLISLFLIVLPLLLISTGPWKAAEERTHMRRLADARMNARLLRFNL